MEKASDYFTATAPQVPTWACIKANLVERWLREAIAWVGVQAFYSVQLWRRNITSSITLSPKRVAMHFGRFFKIKQMKGYWQGKIFQEISMEWCGVWFQISMWAALDVNEVLFVTLTTHHFDLFLFNDAYKCTMCKLISKEQFEHHDYSAFRSGINWCSSCVWDISWENNVLYPSSNGDLMSKSNKRLVWLSVGTS